jgi:ankyrin repeat protein
MYVRGSGAVWYDYPKPTRNYHGRQEIFLITVAITNPQIYKSSTAAASSVLPYFFFFFFGSTIIPFQANSCYIKERPLQKCKTAPRPFSRWNMASTNKSNPADVAQSNMASPSQSSFTSGSLGVEIAEKYRAEELAAQTKLERREAMLGLGHPDTLSDPSALASVLRNRWNFSAAEELFRKALAIKEKVLEDGDSDALLLKSNLISVLLDQSKLEDAEGLSFPAMGTFLLKLGKEHTDALHSRLQLAHALRWQEGPLAGKSSSIPSKSTAQRDGQSRSQAYSSRFMTSPSLAGSVYEIDLGNGEESDDGDLDDVGSTVGNSAGVPYFWRDELGFTPDADWTHVEWDKAVYRAASAGNEAMVKKLLEATSAVIEGGTSKDTLKHTWYRTNCKVVAKPSQDKDSATQTEKSVGPTALHVAARNGHVAVVQLLLDNGACVDAKDAYGLMPIHWAARRGREAVVRLLLGRGIDVNVRDANGGTPMHRAAEGGHIKIVRLLSVRGANVNMEDTSNSAPIHYAAKGGHGTLLKLLLEYGADSEDENQCGQTPVSLAVENKHRGIWKTLRDSDARVTAEQMAWYRSSDPSLRETPKARLESMVTATSKSLNHCWSCAANAAGSSEKPSRQEHTTTIVDRTAIERWILSVSDEPCGPSMPNA